MNLLLTRFTVIAWLICVGLTTLGAGGYTQTTLLAKSTYIQQEEPQEVYFTMRYRGVGRMMVMGYYRDGDILLPVSELFSAFLIPHDLDLSAPSISGHYLSEDRPFQIRFDDFFAEAGDTRIDLNADDFYVDELDFFLQAELFDALFDMDFQVDLSNLILSLSTPHTLPVVEKLERRRMRDRYEPYQILRDDYELLYDRERKWLNGAMLDYTLTSNIASHNSNIYNYNLRGGAEVLGGDLQGTVRGTASDDFHTYQTSDLRWRYAMPGNPWVTSAGIGQFTTSGTIQNRRYTGGRISNEPIVPRVLFDEYIIDGTTVPEAEVEVYVNRRLVDVQTADELGNYRMSIPLTYGSTTVRIVTYAPDGSIEEYDRRIQIPFTFLPAGEFNYQAGGGVLDHPLPGRTDTGAIAEGFMAYGFNNRITAKAGAEYIDDPQLERPLVYGMISSRFFGGHLFSLDLAPDYYYRFNANAFYSNSIHWNVNYTWFPKLSFYNPSGVDHSLHTNVFLPFRVGSIPMGFRLNTHYRVRDDFHQTRYNSDLNMRFGRLTLRVGQRDMFTGLPDRLQTQNARMTASALYSISRAARARVLRGMMLRGQLIYSRHFNNIEQFELQVSRSFLRAGRFRIRSTYSPARDFYTFEAGISFDFNSVHTTSTVRTNTEHYDYRQTFRGSVNYDSHYNDVLFNNRHQAGRSAVSVRMFVDVNNSGTFDKDEGDYLIRDSALRIARAGGFDRSQEGITRFGQLQPYQRYNFEINKSAIRNPMLNPGIEKFSIVTDPNQYKPVDIPFYMAGVVEGRVDRERDGMLEPVAGIRVHLKQTDGDFTATLRTFSSGNFYEMEIPPGTYTVYVDEDQLGYLNVASDPETYEFEIERTSDGDFIEHLDFRLYYREDVPE